MALWGWGWRTAVATHVLFCQEGHWWVSPKIRLGQCQDVTPNDDSHLGHHSVTYQNVLASDRQSLTSRRYKWRLMALANLRDSGSWLCGVVGGEGGVNHTRTSDKLMKRIHHGSVTPPVMIGVSAVRAGWTSRQLRRPPVIGAERFPIRSVLLPADQPFQRRVVTGVAVVRVVYAIVDEAHRLGHATPARKRVSWLGYGDVLVVAVPQVEQRRTAGLGAEPRSGAHGSVGLGVGDRAAVATPASAFNRSWKA